jgi:hypothetical protein
VKVLLKELHLSAKELCKYFGEKYFTKLKTENAMPEDREVIALEARRGCKKVTEVGRKNHQFSENKTSHWFGDKIQRLGDSIKEDIVKL